ncbi:MAG TPA: TlpA disulfide reductase family protein [Phycisphaerales bacterium]|nr:TlpA disulfide reductase family protein [Phycisphaerales bacterium]
MAQWLKSMVVAASAAVVTGAGVGECPAQPPISTKDLIDPASARKDKVEISVEATDVLTRELEIVRDLTSVKGTVVATWTMDVEGRPPNRVEYATEYAVEKPNKLFIDNKLFRVYADGATVTVANKYTHQYVQRPMPAVWMLRDTIEEMSDRQILGFPGEPILRPGMSLEQTLRGVKTVERVRTGEHDGMVGSWVSGTAIESRQPGSIPFTFERWYSDEDHLPRVIKEDWTAMYQDIADRQAIEDSEGQASPKKAERYLRAGWTKVYTRTLNPTIPPETFVFVPGPKSVKVDKFLAIYPGQAAHIALHGKPAPAIVGKDFDGHDIDIASYNGKVVVLDFWAIWCSWCVKGLPAMERIKQHYEQANAPVTMIGVDCDKPGEGERVKRFLAKRGITIQQFDDTSRAVCNTLGVSSWPFVMIIDQNGNVADTDIGYSEGKEQELKDKIDRLLAGKPVRTPEETEFLKQLVNTAASN